MTQHFRQPSETAPSRDFEIVFDHYDPEDERRRESLLSLGNGVIHCRASAPEERRSDAHYPGIYRAGCYARLSGDVEGQAISTDSLANLPNWLPLSFWLEGEPDWLSFDRIDIVSYHQRLDMKSATLKREVVFRDSQGRLTEFVEERFVSMARAHVGALRARLRPLDWSGRVEIRSGLDADVHNELAVTEGGYDARALCDVALSEDGNTGCLVATARTLHTGVDISVAARTRIGLDGTPVEPDRPVEEAGGMISRLWAVHLEKDAVVEIEKVGATFTSRDAVPTMTMTAVVTAARAPGYDTMRQTHVQAWAHLWGRCRLEIADENLSRAANLHAFHLLQTASPHASILDAGLPSRGWQEAYHGQIFWDETLSLSFLSLHLPDVVRSILVHRYRRLDAARQRALDFGLSGALYPWRSGTTGHEETPEFQENPKSGRWHQDDTRFQFHVGSAIAHNVWRYFLATRDVNFMVGYGIEMMAEIARMWASLAKPHPERDGRFTIRGVVGPDEFHTSYPGAEAPGLNDDTYTNIMASWTMTCAAEALERLPAFHRTAVMSRLGLAQDEVSHWSTVASGLHLATDAHGMFLPFDRYDTLRPFDLEAHEKEHPGERLDWFVEAQGMDINALQVQKQATFAMLVHLLSLEELTAVLRKMGHPMSPDDIRHMIEVDLTRTSHDSSLSDLIYAGALSRLSPQASWDMFRDALHPDEKSGHSGTEKGVHLGAMSATLDILQRIYLGLHPDVDALIVDPAPPPHLGRVQVHILFRSNSITVDLDHGRINISADAGNHSAVPLNIQGVRHHLEPGGTCMADLKTHTDCRGETSYA